MSSLERHTCVIRNSGRHNEPTQNEINKWCPLKLLHAYFSLNALDSPNTSTESATVAISSVDNNYNLDLISWTVGLFMERWEKSHWYSCITSNTIEDEVKYCKKKNNLILKKCEEISCIWLCKTPCHDAWMLWMLARRLLCSCGWLPGFLYVSVWLIQECGWLPGSCYVVVGGCQAVYMWLPDYFCLI